MCSGLTDSREQRANYVIRTVSMFRRRLRDAGVPEPQLDNAIAALERDLRAISMEECPTLAEYQDEAARLVGLHEQRHLEQRR